MDPQTAEAGEAYLNSMGFRSLIEWMTAECLLSRPDDPLAFIRSILDEKLSEVRHKDLTLKILAEGLTHAWPLDLLRDPQLKSTRLSMRCPTSSNAMPRPGEKVASYL